MLPRSAPFVVLALLGACRSTPEAAQPDRTTRLEQELSTLKQLLQARAADDTLRLAVRSDVESPAMTELLGRLALLTERIDASMQRDPGTATLRDATSHVPAAAAPAPDHDANALQMLRQSLSVLGQSRNLLLENLAHVRTTAWKRSQLHITTKTTDNGLQLPVAGKVVRVFTPGTLEITERSLDLAIDGDGFFAVSRPDGSTGYTRDGGLQVNAEGKLVAHDGSVLLPEITLPTDTLEIAIDPEGRVCVRTAGSPDTTQQLGQIALHRFVNPVGMSATDGNLLRPTEESGAPITGNLGLLKQGFLEGSNVQLVDELVDLQLVDREITAIRRLLAGYGVFTR
jgi:flagellar basal-body rod protein FlgG